MSPLPLRPRTTAIRVLLVLLRGAKHATRALYTVLLQPLFAIGRTLVRLFVLPLYRLATRTRLRAGRFILPAQGFALLLFTNRYLLHVVIVGVVLSAVALNLSGRQANAQNVGQHSLLYAMVTGDERRITEEAVRPDLLVPDSHYAGPASLLAVPDIDFDYGDIGESLTAISVPGTIVAHAPAATSAEETGSAAPRAAVVTYTVQGGDTLSEIAHRFGVNVGTILWANSRTEFQYLRPGDVLKIPPTSGVLVTVKSGDTLLSLANRYGSAVDEIVRVNRLNPDESLPAGVELTLPGGQPPAVTPTYVSRTPVPTPSVVSSGPRPAAADTAGVPSTKLLWPTSGHVITQYYGWRHTGLDIDGHYDSPIYASHDGVVTTAGWNSGGYGLQILISGGGFTTRYAHASKMFVKVGDTVKKGDVIAMVGTTGRSTGTHLHYEVYVNGTRVNPLSYTR